MHWIWNGIYKKNAYLQHLKMVQYIIIIALNEEYVSHPWAELILKLKLYKGTISCMVV